MLDPGIRRAEGDHPGVARILAAALAPRRRARARRLRRRGSASTSSAGTASRPSERRELRRRRPAPVRRSRPAAAGPAWPARARRGPASAPRPAPAGPARSCAAVGSAMPRSTAGSSSKPAVRNATAGPAGDDRTAQQRGRRAPARAAAHGGPAASAASSASPRAPAVSAASTTSGAPPRSSTGVPRRRSAIARCTARSRSTAGSAAWWSGTDRDSGGIGPGYAGARDKAQSTVTRTGSVLLMQDPLTNLCAAMGGLAWNCGASVALSAHRPITIRVITEFCDQALAIGSERAAGKRAAWRVSGPF